MSISRHIYLRKLAAKEKAESFFPVLPVFTPENRVVIQNHPAALAEAHALGKPSDASWPPGDAQSGNPSGPQPVAEIAPQKPESQPASAATPPSVDKVSETGAEANSSDLPCQPLPVDPAASEMLDRVDQFIARFLSCTAHQRTILVLWILHTHCCSAFEHTPYLDIRSVERESGKTTCMQLLNLLCDRPWMVSGVNASFLARKIAENRPTVLIDDWDAQFRSVDRQSVTALLLSTSRNNASFTKPGTAGRSPGIRPDDHFCPKAFAGNAPLPPALACRSIPVVLKRAQPAEKRDPFRRILAQVESPDLVRSMDAWAQRNYRDVAFDHLCFARGLSMRGLSPHQQDCASPLLTLAERIQGDWPQKIWDALFSVFKASRHEHEGIGAQLLSDIRGAFASCHNPDQLSTGDLLAFLHSLEHRPWNAWNRKRMTPRALAIILRDFEVVPKMMSSRPGLRGYRRKDFADSWKRYLPPAAGKHASSTAPLKPVGKEEMQPAQPQELPPKIECEALQVCEPLAEPASIHADPSDSAV